MLQTIADIMKQTLRSDAFLARYGGEEFTVLFPGIGEAAAMKEAEKLRKTVQEYVFEGQETLPGGNLTISVGGLVLPGQGQDGRRADQGRRRRLLPREVPV